MKSLCLVLMLLLVSVCANSAGLLDTSSLRVAQPPYKVDDYIRAAISLQALGRDEACQTLLASAKTNAMLDRRFFVLCRMLFVPHGTNGFVPF